MTKVFQLYKIKYELEMIMKSITFQFTTFTILVQKEICP